MANYRQNLTDMPTFVFRGVEQCPDCPAGNSLPLVSGENTCASHGWWNSDNGADLCVYFED